MLKLWDYSQMQKKMMSLLSHRNKHCPFALFFSTNMFYVLEVLDLQKNWAASTESSHILPLSPTVASAINILH